MANEILQKEGTPVVWADTTDYDAGTHKPARTAQIDLTSIANNAARQGDKVDLGATHAPEYAMELDVEFDVLPTVGNVVEVYLAWSGDATAGDRNPGGASGADAAYTGLNSNIDASVRQLDGPYLLVCSAAAAAPDDQRAYVGLVQPLNRYVSPVVYNKSGQALEGDAVEMYLALYPLIPEVQ
jgi:hypothetical protein